MVRKNVAEISQNHVTFELEAIDQMYLNAYVPSLQTGVGVVYFLKTQLGVRVPSTVMVAPIRETAPSPTRLPARHGRNPYPPFGRCLPKRIKPTPHVLALVMGNPIFRRDDALLGNR